MKNILNREVPFNPFNGVHPLEPQFFPVTKHNTNTDKLHSNLSDVLNLLDLKDGAVVSFHHHLRNGDDVMNRVMLEISKMGIKNITLVASSIFEVHQPLVQLIRDKTITKIITAYVAGPVAQAISEGECQEICLIHSHGYRAHMIASKEVEIDVAFIGAPCASELGDCSGSEGPSACGSLGYAVADAMYSKKVVVLSDYIQEPQHIQIKKEWVDYVVKVDRLGDPKGIVSGTTTITKDPVGLQISKMTLKVMEATGLLKNGFSFQTGAGGISLAVAKDVLNYCQEHKIKGSFISGGITGYQVDLLEAGIFEKIMDVQCFDLKAVKSMHENPKHHRISADEYAGPSNPDNVVNKLDIVILGATEIDLDFNVNVTTGSDGTLMGGSGGHCDTAAGAKFTIIVSKLVSSRISVVVDKVLTVTTPYESIDALITDRGIAIHPRHHELIEHLQKNTKLPLKTIDELYEIALSLTGKPEPIQFEEQVVALSLYRDGTILDVIKMVKNE
jgi:citrate lyase subunit alpha / citrate CoA-transferase